MPLPYWDAGLIDAQPLKVLKFFLSEVSHYYLGTKQLLKFCSFNYQPQSFNGFNKLRNNKNWESFSIPFFAREYVQNLFLITLAPDSKGKPLLVARMMKTVMPKPSMLRTWMR